MTEQRVLIIQHDFRERMEIIRFLEDIGYKVDAIQDGFHAVAAVLEKEFLLVIADIDTPGLSALDFLKKVRNSKPLTEVMVISAQPLVEDAVALMRHGALDFIVKPICLEQIELSVKRLSAKKRQLEKNSTVIKKQPSVEIITCDKGMMRVLNLAKRVADSTASVLIQGESGTGKELFARYIHQNSRRDGMPFVAINCAALPENLLESELFGHEKGAFTGAISRKEGKFELANNGTLFLDEITEMQYHLQSKLLRVIQEKSVDRLGGTESVEIDVRIIATTNRDIKETIRNGEFREDLYHRLNTIPLTIPPLRQRTGDLKLLCDYFIKKYSNIDARDVKGMTPSAYEILKSQKFTGNVRELQNMIHRAVLLADDEMIKPQDLLMEDFMEQTAEVTGSPQFGHNISDADLSNLNEPDGDQQGKEESAATIGKSLDGLLYGMEPTPLRDMEERMIYHTLDRTEGNRTHAAKLLGISVRTLRNKLNEYKVRV